MEWADNQTEAYIVYETFSHDFEAEKDSDKKEE